MTTESLQATLNGIFTGGAIFTVVGYVITIERRLTAISTSLKSMVQRMKCQQVNVEDEDPEC